MQITSIGLNIAENEFQVHGIEVDEKDREIVSRTAAIPRATDLHRRFLDEIHPVATPRSLEQRSSASGDHHYFSLAWRIAIVGELSRADEPLFGLFPACYRLNTSLVPAKHTLFALPVS
jgi:hypothetical protein